jgi:hypothetical protein
MLLKGDFVDKVQSYVYDFLEMVVKGYVGFYESWASRGVARYECSLHCPASGNNVFVVVKGHQSTHD